MVVPAAAVAEHEVVPSPPSTAPAEPELAESPPAGTSGLPAATVGPRRPIHSGLTIRFGHRPADPGLGGLGDSTVGGNKAHPPFLLAVDFRSMGVPVAVPV